MLIWTWKLLIMLLLVTAAAASALASPPTDPTRPPTSAEIQVFLGGENAASQPEEQRWQLQSVLISDKRRLAIINDRRITEGDQIDSAEVLAIHPGRVELRYRSERIVLTLASRRGDGHHE